MNQELIIAIFKKHGVKYEKDFYAKSEEEQRKLIDETWDVMYGDDVIVQLMSMNNNMSLLDLQQEILHILTNRMEYYEMTEDYFICELMKRLKRITPRKINQINKDYHANSN